jgi:hypothetical protein
MSSFILKSCVNQRFYSLVYANSTVNSKPTNCRRFTSQGPSADPASPSSPSGNVSPSDQARRLNQARRRGGSNKFFTVGVPLIIFCVGGYLFLAEFMKTHVQVKDQKQKATNTKQFEIEEEYKKMMSGLDIENYSLSAIPRPGESVKPNKKISIPMAKPASRAGNKPAEPAS